MQKKLVTETNEQLHQFSPIKKMRNPAGKTEEQSSPDASSEDSDHSVNVSPHRVRFSNKADKPAETFRRPSANRTGGSNNLSHMSSFLQALSRLDGRVVSKPQNCTGVYGQGFQKFIESFEEYASHNFRECTKLWIGQLARQMSKNVVCLNRITNRCIR